MPNKDRLKRNTWQREHNRKRKEAMTDEERKALTEYNTNYVTNQRNSLSPEERTLYYQEIYAQRKLKRLQKRLDAL